MENRIRVAGCIPEGAKFRDVKQIELLSCLKRRQPASDTSSASLPAGPVNWAGAKTAL